MNHGVLITLGVVAYTALVFWLGTKAIAPEPPVACPKIAACGAAECYTLFSPTVLGVLTIIAVLMALVVFMIPCATAGCTRPSEEQLRVVRAFLKSMTSMLSEINEGQPMRPGDVKLMAATIKMCQEEVA